ncbi:MAG TPA: CRISPR-associated helicase Cas3' [Dermatophilaceae bacterium]|jgi:CRISPR-associated endonuclease/helicase Cas3|nr:CRISPR-associated helicase Cas3' [Dermatophilaceae bacterium]HMT89413.1 CRISPR-associated helicase Cas3' [Dermatophilaceae bacterium]
MNDDATRSPSFDEVFARAMPGNGEARQGTEPYDYQRRIAAEGFPELIEVTTGCGKTAVVISWLYRIRFHPDVTVRAATPRRLILVLPTRALTEQTEASVHAWLSNLALADEIGLHVIMGGRIDRKAAQEWRTNFHRPTIVICTIDMMVSRALLRGYGVPRGSYAIDFALVTNGAQIVVDEIQLMPQGTATLRQLSAFQEQYSTAEPSGLTVMSATVDSRILHTVDRPFDAASTQVIGLSPADREGTLRRRLEGTRTIRRLPDTADARDFAAAIAERHVKGTLTLVVVNTVDRAVDTYKRLKSAVPGVELLLIHSRFRGVERRRHMGRLVELANPKGVGGIVVATQAIEAGVDIDARTLVTEAAPWASIVQRAGRCNRAGKLVQGDAVIWWSSPAQPQPYAAPEVTASGEVLSRLEGMALTSEGLRDAGADIPDPDLRLRILRRRDFDQFFDTTPDLSGSDLDVQPFIRAEPDLDLQLAWVPPGWVTVDRGRGTAAYPPEALRCPVSPTKAREFLKRDHVTAWVVVPGSDAWMPARNRPLKPQDVVLVLDISGGYDEELGFSPTSRSPVDVAALATLTVDQVPESATAAQEPGATSPLGVWYPLDAHLADARAQARALVESLDPPGIDPDLRRVAIAAAYLHDVGKAHPDWQSALVDAHPGDLPETEGLWAKSPGRGRLRFMRVLPERGVAAREGFRHELVSVFMLSTRMAAEMLDRLDVPRRWHALVRYLVAAHHGYLRVSARDPRWDGRDGRGILGCFDGDTTPSLALAEGDLPMADVDLGIFEAGRSDSWTDLALDALEELGPFRLAYLETLVRMADWRASAGLALPGGMP